VKHKWTLWLVALVCFGPFAVALFIYYGLGPSWLPQLPGSRELLEQPVPLPAAWRSADDAEPWRLIYARITACEEPCVLALGRLLQVHQALGRDREHVQCVVWHTGELPPLGDAELVERSLDDPVGRSMVDALGAERIGDGRVYLADPRGQLILSYPPDVEQKELLRDLKRLLSGSH
jgi:hypothetical protein